VRIHRAIVANHRAPPGMVGATLTAMAPDEGRKAPLDSPAFGAMLRAVLDEVPGIGAGRPMPGRHRSA